jgi:hypothetical protein
VVCFHHSMFITHVTEYKTSPLFHYLKFLVKFVYEMRITVCDYKVRPPSPPSHGELLLRIEVNTV